MMRPLPVFLLLVLLGAGGPLANDKPPQPAPLDDLLGRAGRFVVRYEEECSAVVAEEHYVQDLVTPSRRPPPPNLAAGPYHRELVSDVLLVQLPDGTFRGFRDV